MSVWMCLSGPCLSGCAYVDPASLEFVCLDVSVWNLSVWTLACRRFVFKGSIYAQQLIVVDCLKSFEHVKA